MTSSNDECYIAAGFRPEELSLCHIFFDNYTLTEKKQWQLKEKEKNESNKDSLQRY